MLATPSLLLWGGVWGDSQLCPGGSKPPPFPTFLTLSSRLLPGGEVTTSAHGQGSSRREDPSPHPSHPQSSVCPEHLRWRAGGEPLFCLKGPLCQTQPGIEQPKVCDVMSPWSIGQTEQGTVGNNDSSLLQSAHFTTATLQSVSHARGCTQHTQGVRTTHVCIILRRETEGGHS